MQAKKRKKIFGNKLSKFTKEDTKKPVKNDEDIEEDFGFEAALEDDEQEIPEKRRKNKNSETFENEDMNDDPFANETPEQTKIRLAKEYLQKFELLQSESTDAAEIDRDLLSQRLKQDQVCCMVSILILTPLFQNKSQNKQQRTLADQVSYFKLK
jgi:hypothetical protein